MGPERRKLERGWRRAAGAFVLSLLALVVGACVIADPPTELPQAAERRPTILRASVVPTTTSVLATWPPTVFIIPVELSNPLAYFEWATFIDYNPVTREGFVQNGVSRYELTTTQGNIRTLELPITEPSPDRCHVVEVIVALSLNTGDIRSVHAPPPPGGDSVSWFYSPGGDLAGCPVLDAGLLPIGPDAEAGAEGGSTER